MRKFILFFILTILLLSFVAFFFKVYLLQQEYYNSKNEPKITENDTPVSVNEFPSVYKDYSKDDYDKALIEKRVIVLFFTSNWCSECLNQDIINSETFLNLNKDGVVGLKVHILDSETTTETDALSKKFDITKESSFVILDKNGIVNFKYVGSIGSEALKEKIQNAN